MLLEKTGDYGIWNYFRIPCENDKTFTVQLLLLNIQVKKDYMHYWFVIYEMHF